MALVIKRTKSGLIIPTTPKLIVPSIYSILGKSREEIIIEEEIRRLVRNSISIKDLFKTRKHRLGKSFRCRRNRGYWCHNFRVF